jgi:hypothetical protein
MTDAILEQIQALVQHLPETERTLLVEHLQSAQ